MVDKEIFCLSLFKSNAFRRPDIFSIFCIPAITKTGSEMYARSNPDFCHRVWAILYSFACFQSQVSKLCFDIKHGKIIQNVGYPLGNFTYSNFLPLDNFTVAVSKLHVLHRQNVSSKPAWISLKIAVCVFDHALFMKWSRQIWPSSEGT